LLAVVYAITYSPHSIYVKTLFVLVSCKCEKPPTKKRGKLMSLSLPKDNKELFNKLAENILGELAKSFPVGINPIAENFGVKNPELQGTLVYLIADDYLHSPEDDNCYYLTPKSVSKLVHTLGLCGSKPIIA